MFSTTTEKASPLNSASEDTNTVKVSDFLTTQSFMNFAAMSAAIYGAWLALKGLNPSWFSAQYVPFALAIVWGGISVGISIPGLKEAAKDNNEFKGAKFWTSLFQAIFLAFLNSLVLYLAVLGFTP